MQNALEHWPVNRWKIIRPHVINIGRTRRAFLNTALTFATMDLKDCLMGRELCVSVVDRLPPFMLLLLAKLNFDARILLRIVSSSTSTFLLLPRSHWSELCKKYNTNFNFTIHWSPALSKKFYRYASSSRPFKTKKLGVSGINITVTNSKTGAIAISNASWRQSK